MPQDDSDATVVVLCGGREVASWPLSPSARLDLGVVDDLARLQLAAGRVGYTVRVRGAGAALAGLLDLAGLEVLTNAGGAPACLGEVGGQAEGGEEGGVDEVVVPDDPVP